MLKKFVVIFTAFLFLFSNTVYAAQISAQSAVVIDADTGIILYENNAYQNMPMASTTKIMTAILALESGRLEEMVTVERSSVDIEGSSLGLSVGDKISMTDLIIGMMLTSGNDAANAIAMFLNGSVDSFVSQMNIKAKEIGMKSTLFVTPSGLDKGNHHSTAYDMAVLTSYAVKNKMFCNITAMKKAVIKVSSKSVTIYNHNKLLTLKKNIFGIKTGYTQKAGRCLVSAEKYYNNKIICVTLNAPDDWNDHLKLFEECEKRYNQYSVCGKIKIDAVGGVKDFVFGVYKKNYYVLEGFDIKIYHLPFVYAPISKNDLVGYVYIYKKGKLTERLPIEADEDLNYYAEQK